MNHAISYEHLHPMTMQISPRKRVMKNSLLYAHKGLVLFKLKKSEYALQSGEAFWLPFDCLTSVTVMPDTELSRIDLSVRIKESLPGQAGYVSLPPVTQAIIQKLATGSVKCDHTKSLLQVVREEVGILKPELILSETSEQFSCWQPGSASELAQDIQLCLKVREARKLILSGTSKTKVIADLFDSSEPHFTQISALLLGKSL